MSSTTTQRETMTPEKFEIQLKNGRTDFRNVVVEGDLRLTGAMIEECLLLRGAAVKGHLHFYNVTIKEKLDMTNVVVKGYLQLLDVRVERGFCLRGAKVEGDFVLCKVMILKERFDLVNAELEGSFSPWDITVEGQVDCGDNAALALQCFLYFGSRVVLSSDVCQRLIEKLLG